MAHELGSSFMGYEQWTAQLHGRKDSGSRTEVEVKYRNGEVSKIGTDFGLRRINDVKIFKREGGSE